jgi:hypothetical protein
MIEESIAKIEGYLGIDPIHMKILDKEKGVFHFACEDEFTSDTAPEKEEWHFTYDVNCVKCLTLALNMHLITQEELVQKLITAR